MDKRTFDLEAVKKELAARRRKPSYFLWVNQSVEGMFSTFGKAQRYAEKHFPAGTEYAVQENGNLVYKGRTGTPVKPVSHDLLP